MHEFFFDVGLTYERGSKETKKSGDKGDKNEITGVRGYEHEILFECGRNHESALKGDTDTV